MRHLAIWVFLLCFWIACGAAICLAAEPSVLDQQLDFPLSIANMPLRQVLGWIDISLGRRGYVVFGLELAPHKAAEPLVSLKSPAGAKLGQVLTELVRQAPAYGFEVGGPRLVNVYPRAWRNDPANILTTAVPRFDAENIQPYILLTGPWEFIPQLAARVFGPHPGAPLVSHGGAGGPKVSLHLRNVTVRDILNRVAQAISEDPQEPRTGWLYVYIGGLSNPSEAHRFTTLPSPRGRPHWPK